MEGAIRETDEGLAERLQQGELEALEELFRRYARPIHGFFYRTTGSVPAAEDLTQEVFLRILRYRSSFRPGGTFRVWIYRIARNVLADERTRPSASASLDDLVREPVAESPSAMENLEHQEDRRLLREGLSRLDPADRELLVLTRFHRLKHAELAELFDCSTGAVKVRAHRALKRLAVEIESLCPGVTR